jgi:hypothetical protein
MARRLSSHELAWNKLRCLISFNRSGKLLNEMPIHYLVLIILATAAWGSLFPEDALTLLAELKHQLRLRVIHRHGEAKVKVLKRKLLDNAARLGIEPGQVESVLAEQHPLIVERLGRQAADEILGEPDSSEASC